MIAAAACASNVWTANPARICSVQPEVPGVATYHLELEDSPLRKGYRFAAGQFNMLYLPGFGEAAISISSDPAAPEALAHTVRVAGNVTRALARLRVGSHVGIRGPFGAAWPVDRCAGGDLVLACGGIGLAPLRPAIYQILRRRDEFGRVILLYGARTSNDLLYTSEWEAWRAAGIEVEVTVDLGDTDWTGHIGVVPVLFYRLRLQPARTYILTCGPEIMMRFVIFEALARKISPEHIFISMERNMNCGMGLCGHCQLGPAFVCRDGPVFTYRQMESHLSLEDL